jgi:tetratricopeptide (TPR) repeat protein
MDDNSEQLERKFDDHVFKEIMAAWSATSAGKYEDALRGFERLLAQTPPAGRRHALHLLVGWGMLAKVHPPALAALTAVRDRDAAPLLAGEGDQALFAYIETVNRELDQPSHTRQLFICLDQKAPALAAACARDALPALVRCEDYALARRYMPDPEARINWASGMLSSLEGLEDLPLSDPHPRPYAEIGNYAKEVRLMLDILNGCDETEAAIKARNLALSQVPQPKIRARVATEIDTPGTMQALLNALRRPPAPEN